MDFSDYFTKYAIDGMEWQQPQQQQELFKQSAMDNFQELLRWRRTSPSIEHKLNSFGLLKVSPL